MQLYLEPILVYDNDNNIKVQVGDTITLVTNNKKVHDAIVFGQFVRNTPDDYIQIFDLQSLDNLVIKLQEINTIKYKGRDDNYLHAMKYYIRKMQDC